MKKYLPILLSLLLTLPLAACDRNTEAETVNTENDYTLQLIRSSASGNDARILSLTSDAEFLSPQASLPTTLPVYCNPYAYGQEGALYEITDTLLATVGGNLSRYLEYLYEGESFQNVTFSSDLGREYDLYYVRNSTEVHTQPNSISILSDEYGLSADIEDRELLDHALVKAAVAYLELQNPAVTRSIEYKTDGTEELRTYIITETTDEIRQDIFNRSFSSITVQKYADSDTVVVLIGHIPETELTVSGEQPMLSRADALSALTAYYPTMDTDTAKVEIYYNATLQAGYFVPCYRFYLKDGETTQATDDFYTVVEACLELSQT